METVSGVVYMNATVRLDGKHFVNCEFRNCMLEYGGEPVIFENTSFSECQHFFFGCARQTAAYMHMMGLLNAPGTTWEGHDVVH